MTSILDSYEFPSGTGIRIREKPNTRGIDVFDISFQVDIPPKLTGRARKRRQFKTKEEAEAFANQEAEGSRVQGEGYFIATQRERNAFVNVIEKLREAEIDLEDAVDFAISRMKPEGGDKTIEAVVEEMKVSKKRKMERNAIREHSYRAFKTRSKGIVAVFGETLLKDLTPDHIKEWISNLDVTNRTRKNYLTCISEILNHSMARKYLADNPMDALTASDRQELCGVAEEVEPEILTITEAERLIKAAHENEEFNLLAAVTLGLFCGIRSEELQKLKWEDIRLDQKFVKIGANIAKKRKIRNVEIPDNAIEWLMLCPNKSGFIAGHQSAFRLRFMALLRKAEFTDKSLEKTSNRQDRIKWKRNGMRHSFGSYHYALQGDSIKTSNELGHSQGDLVLFNHYRALATKEDAEKYFAIIPSVEVMKVVGIDA